MSDEAHLSAKQSRPQAQARVPDSHGDPGGAQGSERTPGSRTQETQRLITLKKRTDFLAANTGRRLATPGFVLLVRDRNDANSCKRVGFTVSRKIGQAV